MEIEKNLVVSTSHITAEDCNILEIEEHPDIHKYEYGYLINLTGLGLYNANSFSTAFVKLYEFARSHEEGFTFLKLDRDGSELEGFETFEW